MKVKVIYAFIALIFCFIMCIAVLIGCALNASLEYAKPFFSYATKYVETKRNEFDENQSKFEKHACR
jgi:uncharacterized BrkB/YihY/UPF0761 family membrane protein